MTTAATERAATCNTRRSETLNWLAGASVLLYLAALSIGASRFGRAAQREGQIGPTASSF